MKQLIFVARHFTPDSGSYAGMIEEVSKYAHSKGYNVRILCAHINKNQKLKEKLKYAEIIRFPVFPFKIPILGMNADYLSLAFKVRYYLRKNPPKNALILANSRAALGLIGRDYVMRIGQPAIVSLKNMEIAKDEVNIITRIARTIQFAFQYILEKICFKNASAYVSSSKESINLAFKYYGGSHKHYFIPHSGIKPSKLKRKRLNKSRTILFIAAGEEKIRKGIIYLERALPVIMKKYSDVKLLHVGEKFNWDVPEWCQKRIISTGRIPWSKMSEYYSSADMLAVCSLNEFIPNIIYEAMEHGLPVVSSDLIGISEVIQHKKSGYIFKRGNEKDLEKAISYILDNPGKAKNMAQKSKKNIGKMVYPNYAKELLRFLKDKKNINLMPIQ